MQQWVGFLDGIDPQRRALVKAVEVAPSPFPWICSAVCNLPNLQSIENVHSACTKTDESWDSLAEGGICRFFKRVTLS